MRTIEKLFFFILSISCLFACREKSVVSLEKEGKKYDVVNQVSFYYPKEFSMDTSGKNNSIVKFKHDDEVVTYQKIKSDSDNPVEQLPELFGGQLEEDGAKNVGYKSVNLKSGLKCYEFIGVYHSTGIKFKYMVYFTANATYSYSYQAPEVLFDEHIGEMTQYLDSLVVHSD